MHTKSFRYLMIFLLGVVLLLLLNGLMDFIKPKVGINPTPGLSETALANAVARYRNGGSSFVDLSTVTTFSWERVYIFAPYTQPSDIDDVVGKSWRGFCSTGIELDDGIALLVFTNNDRVVGCIEHARNLGDFAALEIYKEGFSVQEALFTMDENGSMVWMGKK